MESVKKSVNLRFKTQKLLFDSNPFSIISSIESSDDYQTFMLTLITVFNYENLLFYRQDLPKKLELFISSFESKLDDTSKLTKNINTVIRNYILNAKKSSHSSINESVYYGLLNDKKYRSIPDEFKYKKSDYLYLNYSDYDNFLVLQEKKDDFDDLELFSFLSTCLLIRNCYYNLFYEDIYLEKKMKIISKHLYDEHKFDEKYKDIIDEYYNIFLNSFIVKDYVSELNKNYQKKIKILEFDDKISE